MGKYVRIEKDGKIFNLDDPVDKYIFKILSARDISNYVNETIMSFSDKTVRNISKSLVKKKINSKK